MSDQPTRYYRGGAGFVFRAEHVTDVKHFTPVVVIDFEDEHTLRQIGDLLVGTDRGYDEDSWLDLRDALRKFANPKPAEPTGLGALVRDDEGDLWQRGSDDLYPWGRLTRKTADGHKSWRDAYKHIATVEVIFPGVTEDQS